MESIDLARLIAERIKNDVQVFELDGNSVLLSHPDLTPCLSIMVDIPDGLRVGYSITVKKH